jgi:phosphoglycerate dehydrogenase-like enzyme
MIAACPDLELISVYGVGYDAVDLGACGARGIRVTNTPDVLTKDVADLGVAMMLCQSRGMIGAAQFKAMKSDAVICNVGRGEVIDEAALYEAQSSKRIRGGIIDVWYIYPSKDDPNPWPSRFPFQKLDNVILSPHNSAWTEPMTTRRWLFVAKQLDRFAKGEALENVCFEGEG